ncbi:hypothetical protein GCM10011344_00350 [Dokdonia pacifica]|uniref:Por secretion system C-terminal sorting domain-containing protein n=1 Tax=Dokdonia pacifica TaxID=1627892 RepID=A0A239D3I1_9FLAO|nr:hypothetical protein [Dokdonia pacifica]GGG03949.1 hypothetical protein GCM10011344_00350 [Dokdonia pacifica]SNS26421.1 hypothetical protein SAMN06265376_109105 [Dokdonia pacifica]
MKRTLLPISSLIQLVSNLTHKKTDHTLSILIRKKRYLFILLICVSHTFLAQQTTIPDANFEAFLEANGMGNGIADDHLVTTANIENVTTLSFNVENFANNDNPPSFNPSSITDLTGIEDFTALQELNCNALQLVHLDLTSNLNLEILYANDNHLETIDVTGLTALEIIQCERNVLESLFLNTNPALTNVLANNNSLQAVHIKNGNNIGIDFFRAENNLYPVCVNVDNTAASFLSEWDLDPLSGFGLHCGETNIPDTDFEAFLEANGMGNGIANDTYVITANIENVTTLDLSISGAPTGEILNLTGIEDFTALTALNCAGTNITTINLSTLTQLETLHCENTNLASLDLTANINLTALYAFDTNLAALDLSQNSALTILKVDSNPNLTSLNIKNGNNANITYIFTGSPESNLSCILVDDPEYSRANWSFANTTLFSDVDCATTEIPDTAFLDRLYLLPELDGGIAGSNILNHKAATVTVLDYSGASSIDDLTGIEAFTGLQELYCDATSITSLNLSQNTALTKLHCHENALISLDISQNVLLTELHCFNNDISTLDVSQNILLTELYCNNNDLTDVDVHLNTQLAAFDCSSNQLTRLNLKNGNNGALTTSKLDANPNLTCIKVDDPTAPYLADIWVKDDQSNYDLNCGETYVPDANFENFLETRNSDGDTVPVGDPTSMGNGIANDGIVSTARIENVTALSMAFKGINDLTGIEDFTALESLSCPFNNIVTLDLSKNLALTSLNVVTNDIVSLDVSSNSALTHIVISNNDLTFLNVKNGNNENFTGFFATQNPGLTCINVDDETANYLNGPIWNKDNVASYAEHCFETYVPDANFENYLETHNASGNSVPLNDPTSLGNGIANDQYVLTSRISGVTGLVIDNVSIVDITGIEDFTALETLFCQNNDLTTLNLSANTALKNLRCYNNHITALDFTTNVNLEYVSAGTNNITTLQVPFNTALKELYLHTNDFTTLNVDTCVALERFEVNGNDLHTLSIVNGNNGSITRFVATNNPNLTCISVDDETASYLNTDMWNKDDTASYSIHCNETYIADANFENYLETHDANGNIVSLNDPTSMGNGIANDNYVTTANINTVTSLDISSQNISDVTGIEGFSALETFVCYSNNLTALDVSANTALKNLICQTNNITALDISTNTALEALVCHTNNLTALDLTTNVNLIVLVANDNSITSLNADTCVTLEECLVFNNNLETLSVANGNNDSLTFDATGNPNLTCINVDDETADYLNGPTWNKDSIATYGQHCYETYIPDINFEIYLETHDADGNIVPVNDPSSMGNGIQSDGYVYTNRIANVTSLDVSFFNIVDVTGIEDFIALESFSCNLNSITTLNLSANTALTNLNCSNNLLTGLDLSANVNLEVIRASQNNLTTIDFQQNVALKEIYLQGAGLDTLNLDPCVALEIVDVTYNGLTELSIKNGNNELITQFSAGANPPLNCINVDDTTADYLNSDSWNKDATASYSEHCGETYIPDANFENYLETHDANGNIVSLNDPMSMGNGIANDQYVLTDRISGVTTLNISQLNIADVTGIEDFSGLETFMCFNNEITTLDVSANTALKTLLCYRNNLTTLNTNGNTALITLVCYFNELTTIDISTNTNLEIIEAGNNELTTLDVHSNAALKQISLYNNNLITLSVDACSVLEILDLKDNDLTELRVVNGNNGAITDFDTTLNPNLTCITVDNATEPYLEEWLINVDGSTSFGEHCNETQVPDTSFENYLETHDANGNSVGLGNPTSMGNGIANDGYVRTQSIQSMTTLSVSNLGIADLTGIEDFTSLTILNCSRNLLTSLNVSQNILLENLVFSDNQITTIDLSQNTLLEYVSAVENQLTSLDVSNKPFLEEIDCSENLLTSLNVSQCTVLTDVICNNNDLQTIDFTTNTGLNYFEGIDNDLTSLDVSQNTNLEYFSVENNLLTSLDLSQNTNLRSFSIENNLITSLDLSLNINLEEIICRSNALTSLNIKNGNNTNIDLLFINNNPNLTCVVVDDITYEFPFETRDIQTQYNEITCGIQVSPKVFLQGAMTNPNSGEENLMRDDLRVAGLIPTTSPYADGAICNAAVFNVTGEDAIVDWVFIEVRDATDPTTILAATSALVQRDGDVVSTDGVLAVGMDMPTANYYVAIKHRNHLGVLTASTITLSGAETILDLTTDLTSVTGEALALKDMGNDTYALYAGDTTGDGNILNTDISNAINASGGINVYSGADATMDGNILNTDIQLIIQPNAGRIQQF